MNAADVLKYGHRTVLGSLDGLSEEQWLRPGVCGVWSVKDIVAHLTSFEHVLGDVLGSFLVGGPTPHLDRYTQTDSFNDDEVEQRKNNTVAQVRDEYMSVAERNLELVAEIHPERLRESGTLPWYGAEYAIDDLIVYAYYGHKREHCAQIDLFRSQLASAAPT